MSEQEQSIVIREALPPQWADALATMSDAEFEQRLTAVKRAQARMARIQREVLEPEVDYGIVPGTGAKPTLLFQSPSGANPRCNGAGVCRMRGDFEELTRGGSSPPPSRGRDHIIEERRDVRQRSCATGDGRSRTLA